MRNGTCGEDPYSPVLLAKPTYRTATSTIPNV